MDIVKDPKVNWLGMKWWFLGVSLLLGLVCAASLATKGVRLGVDFTGGTLVYLKFNSTPDLDRIRSVLNAADLGAEEVTRFDEEEANEVQIRMARLETDESEDVTAQGERIAEILHAEFGDTESGKTDLNNTSAGALASWILSTDPGGILADLSISEKEARAEELARTVTDYRIRQSGLVRDFAELEGLGLPDPLRDAIRSEYGLGSFTVISVESVGPKVGQELRERAQSAVLFSLLGMLIYIAFRFRPIYGVAAIVALFHDVFLTLGFFSLGQQEISLTVIAALLTLVGYSINDSIVIFDRVRENLKLMRRNDLFTIFNTSINQCLNRTILTSGMTFLAVFSLFLFGGQALSGFSFALVAGIIIGTYSSVAIASPIVLWWQGWREARKSKA